MFIPAEVSNIEKIVRILYFPNNVKKDNTLRSNVFRSPPDKDEVSIVRVDYCSAKFCKEHGKHHQSPENKRAYFGLAVLTAEEIRDSGADVVSSPLPNNPAHGDIKIGYVAKRGEELPSRQRFIIEEMLDKTRIYEDKDPDSDDWTSGELI